jgi:hypothetical protein
MVNNLTMLKRSLYFFVPVLLFMAACKPSVTPEALYGKWTYTSLESRKDDPVTTKNKLQLQKPTVEFTRKDSLIMVWGGEVIAHGKFRTDGNKIMFNQELEGGRKYEFPFVVDELTDKQITFETKGDDATKVEAVKE